MKNRSLSHCRKQKVKLTWQATTDQNTFCTSSFGLFVLDLVVKILNIKHQSFHGITFHDEQVHDYGHFILIKYNLSFQNYRPQCTKILVQKCTVDCRSNNLQALLYCPASSATHYLAYNHRPVAFNPIGSSFQEDTTNYRVARQCFHGRGGGHFWWHCHIVASCTGQIESRDLSDISDLSDLTTS